MFSYPTSQADWTLKNTKYLAVSTFVLLGFNSLYLTFIITFIIYQ